MKQLDRDPDQNHRFPARLRAVVATLLACGLLAAVPASAAYEQVDHFAGTPGMLKEAGGTTGERQARWPEEVQLGGVGGMAINLTGAGGVPPGAVYSTTLFDFERRVARFDPDGEFRASWTFAGSPPKERCGPDGDPARPVCKSQPSASRSMVDVDVDQTTGYVYVLNGDGLHTGSNPAGGNLIHVYNADGSELITEFGVLAAPSETTAASPAKIHLTSPGGIAVDGAGKVYVFDRNENESYHRLMVFEPQSPGDYENYVYAGQSKDIAAGKSNETVFASNPVTDSAGYIYVAEHFSGRIAKLDPSQPSAPPLCEFEFSKGGVETITVNPTNGEVFFYSFTDKNKIRQLDPDCDTEGEFTETGVIPFTPRRDVIGSLAFNPNLQFEPTRPPGVLYAGAPSGSGGKTEGEFPNDLEESSLGYIFSRPIALPPEIGAQSVSHVTATTAQLHAQINPKGSQTRYSFQYLTEAEYQANEPADRFAGAKEAPLGSAVLGAGQEELHAAAAISGLQPDTAYRYRALAVSNCSVEEPEKVCEDTGADASFHTFPTEAPGLPDGRVYELVSPALKNGGEVFPANPGVDTCKVAQCKPEAGGPGFPLQSTPAGETIAYEGQPFAHSGGPVGEVQYLARRDAKAGWQTSALSPEQASRGSDQGYKAFDTDLSRGLLFQISPSLSPEAPSEFANLYAQPTANPLALSSALVNEPFFRSPGIGIGAFQLRYAGASADLSRVFFSANDVLTEETPFAPEPEDGGVNKPNLYEWSEGQLRLVNVLPGNTETEPGASFGRASTNAISADGSRAFFSDEAGQFYVREDAEVTKEVPGSGKFLSATTDGSKVLLTDGNLYDLETETTTDLTEGEGGFQGIAGQSDDLSSVYFVATSVLDEAPNAEGAVAEAGKFNLYAWNEGANRFVARLLPEDNNSSSGVGVSKGWSSSPVERTAQASPDGRWVAFLSKAPLTGHDNTGPCKEIDTGLEIFGPGPCEEVFLYDSAADELICPSCNASSAPPLGRSFLPLFRSGLTQPRFLTDEGRLYFDSRDSLVPGDTNGGVEDVYQYEPEGVGSCKREAGCISLISAGAEPLDSNFLAIDETAKNVFFTTRDQHVLKDKDDAIDLYVAREGGGTPSETEVARTECQGEACAAAYSPPNDPTPASSAFEGAGNVDEKKKAKKKQKKRKQAKKKRNKRAKARANNNRGGAK